MRAAIVFALAAWFATAIARAQQKELGPYDWFGLSAASVGVVDGRPNFFVAAPGVGLVHQFAGFERAPPRSLRGGGWCGMQMSVMGDLDGDGVADFAIANLMKQVQIRSGRDGRVLYDVRPWVWSTSLARGSFVPAHDGKVARWLPPPMNALSAPSAPPIGMPIDGSEDVDGDGVHDLIVAVLGDEPGGFAVYSGKEGCLVREEIWPSFDLRGAAGDVDRDGCGDILLSTQLGDGEHPVGIRFSIVSGRDSSLLRTFDVETSSHQPHITSALLRDVDGDGVADLAVATCDHDLVWNDAGDMIHDPVIAGRVDVISGRTGAVLRTLRDGTLWNLFGYAVADAGDVDLDGCSDVLVTSYPEMDSYLWRGELFLYSGRDGSLLRHWTGGVDDPLGAFVSGAGDVNADGFPDQLVGSVFDAIGGHEDGALFVLSGFDGSILAHWGEPRFSIQRAER